ncbi:MAG: CCA tRNA nucleotidyltransferase [Bryobacteraceae bacterium]|nr:CCA tRNA nucleotidyltransferase [Bryobacteraceae bacterium]
MPADAVASPQSPDGLLALGREVASRLRDAGYEAWFVGGYVRDRLLGLPLHDLDLATSAPPPVLARLFPHAQQAGAHFGVLLVRGHGAEVQVATYRTEASYLDGRHPSEVRFETDVREDVRRRDFTINALLEDPWSGEIVDHTGGREDLARKLIRAIGDPRERFAEDHLRLLRAVRFAARFGFEIEPATMDAIRASAPLIRRTSPERVRDEIARMLVQGEARRAFELLDTSGLLAVVLPEVARMKGVPQPPDYHPEGDVWVHTLLLLEQLDSPRLELALAALLHDIGKPVTCTVTDRIRFNNHDRAGAAMAREILHRLRFPREVCENTVSLIAQHMRFSDALNMRDSTFKRFTRQPVFEMLLELYRMDKLAGNRDLTKYYRVRERFRSIPPAELRPAPLLTGHDLLALGVPQGPEIGRLLAALEDEQLEGRLSTREEAQAWLRKALAPGTT